MTLVSEHMYMYAGRLAFQTRQVVVLGGARCWGLGFIHSDYEYKKKNKEGMRKETSYIDN